MENNMEVPKKKNKKGKKKSEPPQGTTPKVPKKAKTWVPEMRDRKADVSAWKDLFVPKPVLRALSFLGFSAPTPVQALTLAPAIRDKLDILGAAETGKGILIWPAQDCFWIELVAANRLVGWETGMLGARPQKHC